MGSGQCPHAPRRRKLHHVILVAQAGTQCGEQLRHMPIHHARMELRGDHLQHMQGGHHGLEPLLCMLCMLLLLLEGEQGACDPGAPQLRNQRGKLYPRTLGECTKHSLSTLQEAGRQGRGHGAALSSIITRRQVQLISRQYPGSRTQHPIPTLSTRALTRE